MSIDQKLLSVLACPDDHADVTYHQKESKEYLVCTKCRRKFPIRDGIPQMLPIELVDQS